MMKDDEHYIDTLRKIKNKVLSEDWTAKKLRDMILRNFRDNGVDEKVFPQTTRDGLISKVHALGILIQTLDMTRNPEKYDKPRLAKERVRELLTKIGR